MPTPGQRTRSNQSIDQSNGSSIGRQNLAMPSFLHKSKTLVLSRWWTRGKLAGCTDIRRCLRLVSAKRRENGYFRFIFVWQSYTAAVLFFWNLDIVDMVFAVAASLFEGNVELFDALSVENAAAIVVSLPDLRVWLGQKNYRAIFFENSLSDDAYTRIFGFSRWKLLFIFE